MIARKFPITKALPLGLAALALGASACGKVQDAAKDVAGAASNPELQHSWQEARCDSVSIAGAGVSKRTQYDFSGNQAKKTVLVYGSGNCTDSSPTTLVYEGTFSTQAAAGDGTTPIDINYNKLTVTPNSDAARKVLNLGNCFGGNYTGNGAVDRSGQAAGACPFESTPTTDYDLYKVDSGSLYLGQGGAKQAPNDRPKQVDTTEPFTH